MRFRIDHDSEYQSGSFPKPHGHILIEVIRVKLDGHKVGIQSGIKLITLVRVTVLLLRGGDVILSKRQVLNDELARAIRGCARHDSVESAGIGCFHLSGCNRIANRIDNHSSNDPTVV